MNSRERMAAAMRLGTADKVPVMCQLAIGHYFLHTGIDPLDIWFRAEPFADALVMLQQRYHFDGILVNLPGRDPGFDRQIERIDRNDGERIIRWKNGCFTVLPDDDNPHYYRADASRYFPSFQEIDPASLYYVEPWDITDITYPYTWGFDADPQSDADFFPDYHLDSLRAVRAKAGPDVSVHAEVFSPWSQFLELLNYESALMAVIDDPAKVHACLGRLTEGAIDLVKRQAGCGADAILISSAFAGAGLISRQHYDAFVLPYEGRIVAAAAASGIPVYTHTCGSIGDRLDLMLATGTNGVDTLDPPPLGTVDLQEAKNILNGRAFIKGNIDPVNTLLQGTESDVAADVQRRLEIGAPGGGYILSTACSVAPHTPPGSIALLAELRDAHGQY